MISIAAFQNHPSTDVKFYSLYQISNTNTAVQFFFFAKRVTSYIKMGYSRIKKYLRNLIYMFNKISPQFILELNCEHYIRGANNQVDCGAGIPQGSMEKKGSCLEVRIEEKIHHTLSPGAFKK